MDEREASSNDMSVDNLINLALELEDVYIIDLIKEFSGDDNKQQRLQILTAILQKRPLMTWEPETRELILADFPQFVTCRCNGFIRRIGWFIEDGITKRCLCLLKFIIMGICLFPFCACLELGEIAVNCVIRRKKRRFANYTLLCIIPLISFISIVPAIMVMFDKDIEDMCFRCKRPRKMIQHRLIGNLY